MNNRIFLSHSSSDKDAVRHLAEDLKRAGLDVWLDDTPVATDIPRRVGIGGREDKHGNKFSLSIPGGFLMGSEKGEENERPLHQVSVNRPFYMSIYTITQAQWRAVMHTEPWRGDP